ncbi:MAG: hypothetical protein CMN28_08950 [Salinisphaeraceae bacterium]|nr:hypothetical protein [Salinisphaeraceae bacterium]
MTDKKKTPDAATAAPRNTVKPRHAPVFAAAAELSPLPFLLVDAKGIILAASRGAQLLVDREKSFAADKNRLAMTAAVKQQSLTRLIEKAIDGKAPDPRSSTLVLKVERSGNAPLALLVSAIPGFSSPPVAVYLHEPSFTARISEPVLCELYDLTPAEARVARMMVNGGAPREIAEQSNTSVHTVRNQIKSVFSKTGAARQAELAILLLGGPAHTR